MNVIVQLTYEVKTGREKEFERTIVQLVESDRVNGLAAALRILNRVLPQQAEQKLLARLIGSSERIELVPTSRVVVELTFFHVQDFQRASDDRDRGRRWQDAFAAGQNAPAALAGVQILQAPPTRHLRAVGAD